MKIILNDGTHVCVEYRNEFWHNFLRMVGILPVVSISTGSVGYFLSKRKDVRYVAKQYKKGIIHQIEDLHTCIVERLHVKNL